MDLFEEYNAQNYSRVIQEGLKMMSDVKIADIMHIVGLSLTHEDKLIGAQTLLKTSLALMPNEAWYKNASWVFVHKNADVALEFVEEGLQHFPKSAELLHLRGIALYFSACRLKVIDYDKHDAKIREKLRKSIIAFDESLAIETSNEVLINKGVSLLAEMKVSEALECFNQVISTETKKELIQLAEMNKARCLAELMHDQMAIDILQKYKGNQPAEFDTLYGSLNLAIGNFEEGWKYFHRRWDGEDRKTERHKPTPASLDDIKGKKVLIINEQGYGDILQFIRFIKHFPDAIVLVPKPLIRLLEHSFPNHKFVDIAVNDHDYEIGMMDMAMLLGINLTNIPNEPYLSAESKVPYGFDGIFRVGFCWKGSNMVPIINERRSIPQNLFDEIIHKAEDLNLRITSLQYGEKIQGSKGIYSAPSGDWYDTAQMIEPLDLVITVDTSVAHLAAAMGKEVWILNRYDQCWRWLRDREDSPWYQNVRLFRQPAPIDTDHSHDWKTPIKSIIKELTAWVDKKRSDYINDQYARMKERI